MMGAIRFQLIDPPADLARDVECIRVAHQDNPAPLEVRTCAHGTPGLVFHTRGEGAPGIEAIATRTRKGANFPLLFLHGPGSEPSVMTFSSGAVTTLQAVFKPQALGTVFGLAASDFLGIVGPAEIGAQALLDQLLGAADDEMASLVWAYLRQKLAQAGTRDELVERSLGLIASRPGMSVQELIERLNISERQFEKRFSRAVGCPPQRYLRVKRINEALRLMVSGQYERLTDVAYALDFYDQSHFIRDMKEFSWITPREITQKVSDFRLDQTGVSYQ